ncbi:Cof-type HAD-IIB family hydrolase [Pseudobacteroides cellulosolvens]|uniref:Cof-like hydrolase n=1 Tax=Pseudobacteroides cellulosolvens ATCC 35603 = DSM 2933 TaxID=398512 RepID=A0A0L6JMH3_9FIRM|nr:Cof-type HAD-IIB family hydrolase [Pseudobacteroides cellulosolvens]KNY26996.1 Cof-like hydrolase [Pseudobacteroides cellulosolvens ATCC 35603 = DSM 2933]
MSKLIFIDLDGTLLSSDKRVSKENRDAIRNAEQKGLKVIICTGKVFKSAKRFAHEIGIKGPLISCNGAEIRDIATEKLLYSDFLRKEDCYKIIDICRRKRIYFHAYIDHDMFTEMGECPTPLYWIENTEVPEEYRINIRVVSDFKEVVNKSSQNVSKFLMVSKDRQQLIEVRHLLEEIDTVNVMCSGDDNIEVVNKNVNKGKALVIVSESSEYSEYEIVAMGDSENDLSMLLESQYKIVMGNADESLKKIADFISATNDENGVAIAIEQILN